MKNTNHAFYGMPCVEWAIALWRLTDIVFKNLDLRLVFLKDIVYRETDLLTSMIMIMSL